MEAFELWVGEVIGCSELIGLFSRNLKDNAESSAGNEGLACEASKGSSENLSKDFIRAFIRAIM